MALTMRLAIWVLTASCLLGQDHALREVLDRQAAAWNRGDIEAFMTTYERSEKITFFGKALTHGYEAVLARYRKNYGTREAMGNLRFEVLETRPLGPDYALLLGKFFLTRPAAGGGDASGQFTLILHKTPAGWKIIHDHTGS